MLGMIKRNFIDRFKETFKIVNGKYDINPELFFPAG